MGYAYDKNVYFKMHCKLLQIKATFKCIHVNNFKQVKVKVCMFSSVQETLYKLNKYKDAINCLDNKDNTCA